MLGRLGCGWVLGFVRVGFLKVRGLVLFFFVGGFCFLIVFFYLSIEIRLFIVFDIIVGL